MTTRRLLLATLLLGGLAGSGVAAEHPIAGDLLALRDPASGARKVRFKALRDPGIDPAEAPAPTSVVATLEIAGTSPGDGTTGTIGLDPVRWTAVGVPAGSRGYRFFDRSGATSGVRKILFRPGSRGGTLSIAGGGTAWPYAITQAQGAIDVRFTLGSEVYCARFTNFGTPLPSCPMTGLALPVLEYCHNTSEPGCTGAETTHPTGCSITGGFVYRGCRMPDLRGRYFYSDYCRSFIRTFRGVSGGEAQDVQDHTDALRPASGAIDHVSSFGEDARGELYVVDLGNGASDGEVYEIVPGP